VRALFVACVTLGYLWAAPTTLLSVVVFLLPMWALQQIRPRRWREGAWEWSVVAGSRFWRAYSLHGWSATTLGWCIFFSPLAERADNVARHERRHVAQNLVLGPLFLPLYALLWFAFGYLRHPLERDARIAAGEVL
jgi:hypothetical protein